MTAPLRIAVADDEPDMREYFQKLLIRLGHKVVVVASTGRELVEKCRLQRPDLVITDIRMPEMDGIDAATQLYDDHPVAVILVSAYHDPELIRRAEVDHVMAYLVKPIKQSDLEPAIALARHRFVQFEALRQEAADLREALENRKVIGRALDLLGRRAGLDEPGAFRHLQELAGKQSKKLIDMAQAVLLADQPDKG